MFANPRHIPNDMESNDDGIMEFDGPMTMEQSDVPTGGSNDTMDSLTPMEKVLAQLVTTMQDITNECKKGDVTFCEHGTSHMRVLACNIHNICLTKANAILHPGLVLHHVEKGFGNNVKQLKNLT